MKYTKEERLKIGKRIYEGEISRYEAAFLYDISEDTARQYMRLYRASKQLPPKNMQNLAPPSGELAGGLRGQREFNGELGDSPEGARSLNGELQEAIKAYDHMTREELILELLKHK